MTVVVYQSRRPLFGLPRLVQYGVTLVMGPMSALKDRVLATDVTPQCIEYALKSSFDDSFQNCLPILGL